MPAAMYRDNRLARHVQNRVRFVGILFQLFDGFGRWKDDQRDLPAFRFAFHVVHHGQSTSSSADDQTTTFPWNLFFDRNRCVSELVAKFLRRLLLTLTHVSAVDHYVVFVGHTVDSDGTKGEFLEAHFIPPQI